MAKKKTREKSKKNRTEKDTITNFVPIAKELELAYDRVTSIPARKLRWLLEFAGLDLGALSQGRSADLGWELVFFGLNRRRDQLRDPFELFSDLATLTAVQTEEEAMERKRYGYILFSSGPSPIFVSEFHSTIRGIFDTLFKGEYWEFRRPSPLERIVLHLKPGTPVKPQVSDFSGMGLLMIQTTDLIKAEMQRLKICQNPRCGRRFVAAKKTRARFCSSKCSAYVRVNKARGITIKAPKDTGQATSF